MTGLAHLRHELRTPLNHIIGYAELLLEDAGPDRAALATDLRRLLDDARGVLGIVNERLAPGGKDAETVDVAALGRAVIDPATRIVVGTQALARGAEALGARELLPDLARIAEAADRLAKLLAPGDPGAAADAGTDGARAPAVEPALRGVILVITAPFGNAATRLEPYVTKNGIYAYGSVPEIGRASCRERVFRTV